MDVYSWIKAVHVIVVVAWMAGMFYLPRLLVYHAGTAAGSDASEMLKVMERRLLRLIINPAMILTWIFGILLIVEGDWFGGAPAGWLHVKILLVLVMSGVHGFLAGQVRRFGRDERPRPARFYRILNEVPTLLLIAIVILVVVKPF